MAQFSLLKKRPKPLLFVYLTASPILKIGKSTQPDGIEPICSPMSLFSMSRGRISSTVGELTLIAITVWFVNGGIFTVMIMSYFGSLSLVFNTSAVGPPACS